jgi:hypothetical protein
VPIVYSLAQFDGSIIFEVQLIVALNLEMQSRFRLLPSLRCSDFDITEYRAFICKPIFELYYFPALASQLGRMDAGCRLELQ